MACVMFIWLPDITFIEHNIFLLINWLWLGHDNSTAMTIIDVHYIIIMLFVKIKHQ